MLTSQTRKQNSDARRRKSAAMGPANFKSFCSHLRKYHSANYELKKCNAKKPTAKRVGNYDSSEHGHHIPRSSKKANY